MPKKCLRSPHLILIIPLSLFLLCDLTNQSKKIGHSASISLSPAFGCQAHQRLAWFFDPTCTTNGDAATRWSTRSRQSICPFYPVVARRGQFACSLIDITSHQPNMCYKIKFDNRINPISCARAQYANHSRLGI